MYPPSWGPKQDGDRQRVDLGEGWKVRRQDCSSLTERGQRQGWLQGCSTQLPAITTKLLTSGSPEIRSQCVFCAGVPDLVTEMQDLVKSEFLIEYMIPVYLWPVKYLGYTCTNVIYCLSESNWSGLPVLHLTALVLCMKLLLLSQRTRANHEFPPSVLYLACILWVPYFCLPFQFNSWVLPSYKRCYFYSLQYIDRLHWEWTDFIPSEVIHELPLFSWEYICLK